MERDMKKKKPPYTANERVLARRQFEAAKVTGMLKTPPGLFAIEFSDGRRASKSCIVTENDYLRDARCQLARPDA